MYCGFFNAKQMQSKTVTNFFCHRGTAPHAHCRQCNMACCIESGRKCHAQTHMQWPLWLPGSALGIAANFKRRHPRICAKRSHLLQGTFSQLATALDHWRIHEGRDRRLPWAAEGRELNNVAPRCGEWLVQGHKVHAPFFGRTCTHVRSHAHRPQVRLPCARPQSALVQCMLTPPGLDYLIFVL